MSRLALAVLAAAALAGPALAADPAPVTRAYPAPTAFIATSVTVPPGCVAEVVLPQGEYEVGAGTHAF